MQQVLLLEPDKETADRLLDTLQAAGAEVSFVKTMREACLALTHKPHELAIVPLADTTSLVRSFRALQPDLPVIVTSHEPDGHIPADQLGLVQDVLLLADLERSLPGLLAKDWTAAEDADETVRYEPPPEIDRQILEAICSQPEVTHGLQQVVFSTGREVLTFGGLLGDEMAQIVTGRVNETWGSGRQKAQLQYLKLSDMYDLVLLYTRPVAGCLLTLVALPPVLVTELRKQADFIAGQVTSYLPPALATADTLVVPANGKPSPTMNRSLVIAWRPVRPLPNAIQSVLGHYLERLAKDNGYQLHDLQVEPDLIHLVVSCPSDCSSAAIAHLFKFGTEQAVENQFGLHASLWLKGYYAAESRKLMPPGDLDMLLEPMP